MSLEKKPKAGQFVKIKYHHDSSGGENLNPYLITAVEEQRIGYKKSMVGRGKNRKEVEIAAPHARTAIWITCVTGKGRSIRFTGEEVIEIIEEIDF